MIHIDRCQKLAGTEALLSEARNQVLSDNQGRDIFGLYNRYKKFGQVSSKI